MVQHSEDGYIPQWTTAEQDSGEETVQEHLVSGHGQGIDDVAKLTVSEAHRLHDRLHDEAGHTATFDLMAQLGFKATMP